MNADARVAHATLDRLATELAKHASAGDWNDARAVWHEFETKMLDHMRQEETDLLPGYREHDAEDAERLLQEHEAFRAAFGKVVSDIDAASLNPAEVRAILNKYRMHQLHEETGLYRWRETKKL